MERMCKFAILKYIPDEIRKEFINIGLVFHSPEDNFIDIKLTKNFSRVTAFDDEVDIDFLKLVLEGVKSEFSQKIEPGAPPFNDLTMRDFLECATAIYANQLQFSPIYSLRSKDIEKDFEDLFKTYVYFENPNKQQRITGDRVKSIMNRVLKEKDVLAKLQRDYKIDIGTDEIELDYVYKTANLSKVIKTFSFDYTDRGSNSAPQQAKEWAWNYSKLKSINNANLLAQYGNNINIVTFVYVGNINKSIKIALDILEEESGVIQANNPESIEKFADKISQELVNLKDKALNFFTKLRAIQ